MNNIPNDIPSDELWREFLAVVARADVAMGVADRVMLLKHEGVSRETYRNMFDLSCIGELVGELNGGLIERCADRFGLDTVNEYLTRFAERWRETLVMMDLDTKGIPLSEANGLSLSDLLPPISDPDAEP